MRNLSEAAELRETPVIGAYIIWHFVKAYCDTCHNVPSIVLVFVAIGILTNVQLARHVGKQKNLSCFRRDLVKNKESDCFAGITRVIKEKFSYTTAALDIAVAANLITMNTEEATVTALPSASNIDERSILTKDVLQIGTKAEQLGKLFAKWGDGQSVLVELEVKL